MIYLFGERIKKLRRNKGFTKAAVAKELGVSEQKLYQWEISDGYPDDEMTKNIAEFFGVSLEYLTDTKDISAEEKYKDISDEWDENNKLGDHNVNYTLMHIGLNYFQNDSKFRRQLLVSLENMGKTDKENKENLETSLKMQERFLNNCNDIQFKYELIKKIIETSEKLGDKEKSEKYKAILP